MHCLPDSLLGRTYYVPTEQGLESRCKQRLEAIKTWKKKHEQKDAGAKEPAEASDE